MTCTILFTRRTRKLKIASSEYEPFYPSGETTICSEHHRAPRHTFVASVELTDVQSEKRVDARTKDVSLFGCFAETTVPLPEGTKVRFRIVWAGSSVAGLGKVAYTRPGSGVGIHFLNVEPSSLPILERWLANLRE